MASEVPEYFLPRNWDYPPTGPIQLGNVITSLKEPHLPLATVSPDVDLLVTSQKTLASIETAKMKSGGVTVMTTFLSSLLGAGADVGVEFQRSSERDFAFDSLDTTHVNTATKAKYQAYIETCLQQPRVLRELKLHWFQRHVYVITGLKVVKGAKCSTNASHTNEAVFGAQVDGTIISGGSVPVGGGPEVHGGRVKKLKMSWGGSTDFVLAFKVSKVSVNQAGEVKKEKEYLKGAFMELPSKQTSDKLIATIAQHPTFRKGIAVTVAEDGETVTLGIVEVDENDDSDSDSGEDSH